MIIVSVNVNGAESNGCRMEKIYLDSYPTYILPPKKVREKWKEIQKMSCRSKCKCHNNHLKQNMAEYFNVFGDGKKFLTKGDQFPLETINWATHKLSTSIYQQTPLRMGQIKSKRAPSFNTNWHPLYFSADGADRAPNRGWSGNFLTPPSLMYLSFHVVKKGL